MMKKAEICQRAEDSHPCLHDMEQLILSLHIFEQHSNYMVECMP